MQHATCNMQHATCNMQHATCNMQHATCNMQHATCNMQHATCNMQQATCNNMHRTFLLVSDLFLERFLLVSLYLNKIVVCIIYRLWIIDDFIRPTIRYTPPTPSSHSPSYTTNITLTLMALHCLRHQNIVEFTKLGGENKYRSYVHFKWLV